MIDTDVLVVGGGPVGLSLACELGWRGLGCLLIDDHEENRQISEARINLINIRSMEFCRRWGIEHDIRHAGFPGDYPMTVVFVTSLRGKLIARLPYPAMDEQPPLACSPTQRQRIPQHLFEPVLRRAAQAFPRVRTRYRTRFESLVQSPECVEAELTDLASGRRFSVRARYLAGCDGGHSSVREALGIGLVGENRISYSCGIYFRAPELWKRHDKGKAIMNILVGPDGTWANLTMIDGRELWRLSLYGGSEYVAAKDIDVAGALRRAMGGEFDYEVLGVYPWTRRAVVAESYHRGRCLLVGDAAHQLSPTGGFGMNTGMGDAVDLGWKLEATLAGWGADGLLDSYDAERRPIGERNVREATINFRNVQSLPSFPWIGDEGAEADAKRAALGEHFMAATRQEWESEGVQLGYRYDASPIVAPDGSAAPPDDPMTYVPSARPGSRAPHAWIASGRSTLDLFGRGYSLLSFGAAPGEFEGLERAAAARGVPIAITRIDDPEIASLHAGKLVLVRPDGHVAWRGDQAPADALALVDRIRGALARRSPAGEYACATERKPATFEPIAGRAAKGSR